jgi:NADP-dependent 3-hydroxy acid dehydrogenase YdfG
MSMDRWEGHVALVTGASSGIGRAIAVALYQAGMKVAVCARRHDRLQELQSELGAVEERWLSIETDLREEASILSMFSTIRERWGGVDVLVNNAGLGHHSPLLSGDTEMWRETLEVNVLALSVCSREAVQDMMRQKRAGHVIHISSMSGHRVPSGSGMYSASKYAVRALTEGLRKELRQEQSDIRVSAVSPGFVETEFAALYHRSEEAAVDTYSRFKTLEAKDIADAVVYALGAPPYMQVHDILIRPTQQES